MALRLDVVEAESRQADRTVSVCLQRDKIRLFVGFHDDLICIYAPEGSTRQRTRIVSISSEIR